MGGQLLFLDWARRLCGWRWAEVGFNRFRLRPRELGRHLLIYLLVAIGLAYLFTGLPAMVSRSLPELLHLFLLAVAALNMEILMRGFVQGFCRARWRRGPTVLVPALLACAPLLLHQLRIWPIWLNLHDVLTLLVIFVQSLGLGLLQERYRNLWVPTLATMLYYLCCQLFHYLNW